MAEPGEEARPGTVSDAIALSDWEVERLAEHLDGLLDVLLERGDSEVAATVVALVEGIERLHAEGVRRLTELLARDPDLLARARRDPVVSSLFELYDVSTAADADVAGVEALDPGGVSPTGDVSIVPAARLVQLRGRLGDGGAHGGGDAVGDTDPGSTATGGGDGLRPRAGTFDLADLGDRDVSGLTIESVSVLIVRGADGVLRAYRNACPGTPLPLHLGELEGGALRCPWHGCRFAASTGARLDEQGPGLRPLSLETEDARIRITIE